MKKRNPIKEVIEGGRDEQVITAVKAAMTFVCDGDTTAQQQCLEIDKRLSKRGVFCVVPSPPGHHE